MGGCGGVGLGAGEALGVRAGQLAATRGFVEIGGPDGVGHDADLGKQREAAGAGGGEDEGGGSYVPWWRGFKRTSLALDCFVAFRSSQ
jgi:hypothetical protein